MKLKDLIEALANEVVLARTQLDLNLEKLAQLEVEDADFMTALDQYSGQVQRMGEAAELAGFAGLQAVCGHVMENSLLLASMDPPQRVELVAFLRGWPPLIVEHLRNLSDPSTAAGLVDHLRAAPSPMDEEASLKVMHMLGAMPLQVALPGEDSEPRRPVLATSEDVALDMPEDVDESLRAGFFHEAPEHALHLVSLARMLASGEGDSSDVIAAKRVAHTLKGSGSIIGLRGIASLGHHLEDVLEHLESAGPTYPKPATDALLDAAYCVEQMVGYVSGTDEYPVQAQAVLQVVLDLANRIDRGESIDTHTARVGTQQRTNESGGVATEEDADHGEAADTPRIELVKPTPLPAAPASPGSSGVAAAGAALRVSLERVDELFRVSGEVSVHTAAMEARIKSLVDSSRDLLAQNLRVQKRLFELETVVDVRTLTMLRARSQRSESEAFDPLEMDQYSELHTTAHALVEEAADARMLAQRLEEEIAQIGSLQAQQQRLSKDMQHLVVSTRMAEVSVIESRLQRNVRSTCQATGKNAMLIVEGGDTLIDSDVLSRLAEPLLHLLRNAVDHGLETPAERASLGKPATGSLRLRFARQGQQVVLQCEDDGRGLDLPAIQRRAVENGLIGAQQALGEDEIARLILLPGFSTRSSVTEVSGRGVGLDVVHEWVSAMNGSIRITSRPGQGCMIEMRFAASLSTIHSLIVHAGGQRFALPSVQVEQAVPSGVGQFETVGDQVLFRHGKQAYPALRLADLAGLPVADGKTLDEHDVVVVNFDNKSRALAVDGLIDARELLVKNAGRYARHVRGVTGLSILGDGGVAVNLDVAQLFASGGRARNVSRAAAPKIAQEKERGVLIVDDALSVRNSLLQLVQDAGFRAKAARDGIDAIDTLRSFRPHVVLTDLEMPNMNGVELTSHIKSREDLKGLPVIMITSRSQDKHRRLAEQAGVDEYVTKPYNDVDLLQKIRQAIVRSPEETMA